MTGEGPEALTERAGRLKAEGRREEALRLYAEVVRMMPRHPIPEHNVAATLADLHRFSEAEAATRRALSKGGRAPETWLLHGRALKGLDRFDEAEAAFREAIRGRPGFLDAHRALAELVWIRTEDAGAALKALDIAMKAAPGAPGLPVLRAQVLSNAGDEGAALAALEVAARMQPADATLMLALSSQAVRAGRPAEAVAAAERAHVLMRGAPAADSTLCEAYLALGRVDEALRAAERLRAAAPDDQGVLALLAICWRLVGDPRYPALYHYDGLVRAYTIETPRGWPTLSAYLDDLTVALGALHATRAHPLGQSLRWGSQTNRNLLDVDHPALKAFPQAVEGPIRSYMAALGQGPDPLRARNRRGYRISGIWSVRLRAGGFHIDHVHPDGWLSSACYIALPPTLKHAGREGWIKFGEPGPPTSPPLGPEHFVRPEPGRLVLFPSYMWHGTVPFEGDQPRLTVAFDVVPDRKR